MSTETPTSSTEDTTTQETGLDIEIVEEPSGEPATEETQEEPQTPDSGTAMDYLNPEPEQKAGEPDESWKKRYADSTREAQKLAQEKRELLQLVERDPDLKAEWEEKLGQSISPMAEVKEVSDPRVDALEQKIREEDIRRFEEGKKITNDIRKKMQPIVSRLHTHPDKPMPLAQALEIAYASVVGTSPLADGKAEAKAKLNQLAATPLVGKGQTVTSAPGKLQLTSAEFALAKKLGGVDENGRLRPSFAAQLKLSRGIK